MKKIIISLVLGFAVTSYAAILTCPDPRTSSLYWGGIPVPWIKDPFSANTPQGDAQTTFVRANILVAGVGRGIVCTYKNSIGNYSIWWPVRIKIPATVDYNWIATPGGYICTEGIDECEFSVAVED